MGTKRALNFEEFALDKLKYNSKTGLEIDYYEKSGSKDKISVKSDNLPHPHLLEALKSLSPYVSQILGLQKGWDYAREQLKSDEFLLTGAIDGSRDADKQFTVSGIALSGEGQNSAVKITGSLKCLSGATGMASPLIRFKGTSMAIEQTIEGICDKIAAEAYSFLFSGKVGNPGMFSDDEQKGSKLTEVDLETGKKIPKGGKKNKQLKIDEEAQASDAFALKGNAEE